MDITEWAAARTEQPQRPKRRFWHRQKHYTHGVCATHGVVGNRWLTAERRWLCKHCSDPISALDTVANWAVNNPRIDAEQAADCIDSFARVADALARPPRMIETPYGRVDERDTERLRLRNWRQHSTDPRDYVGGPPVAAKRDPNPFKRGGLRGNSPADKRGDCPCGCGPPIADARTQDLLWDQSVVRKQLATTFRGTDQPGQIVMLERGQVVLSRDREELIRKYAKPEQPCGDCETVVTDGGTVYDRICTGRCVTDVTVNRPEPDRLTSIKS